MAFDDLLKRAPANAQVRRGFVERKDATKRIVVIRSNRTLHPILPMQ
jgi:ribosomal protein S17